MLCPFGAKDGGSLTLNPNPGAALTLNTPHSELRTPNSWRRRLRWTLTCLGLLLAGRLAAVRGLIVPVRIAGGSMAETLLGEHFELRCDDCQVDFNCDAQPPPASGEIVCPNCGFQQPLAENARRMPGQRVLVDRFAFLLSRPRRGDIVAFRDPLEPSRLAVKRLIGLPGERISITDGDLFIDGRRPIRSLGEQKRVATCVYDDSYRARRRPARWRASKKPSRWSPTSRGFRFSANGIDTDSPNTGGDELEWLIYHHQASFAGPLHHRETPVVDNCGYNQEVSRTLNTVRDLLLSCQLKLSEQATDVAFRIHDGRELHQVTIDRPNRRVVLTGGGQRLAHADFDNDLQDSWIRVEYSTFDGELQFAVNGRTVIRHRDSAREGAWQPTSTPVGIGLSRGSAELTELRLSRDSYYLPPPGRSSWQTDNPFDRDCWIVLGDNGAVSIDSRHWAEAGLPRRLVMGRVLAMPAGMQ